MNNEMIQEPDELGPEVESEDAKAMRMAAVEAFAKIIQEKRKDAITARSASGIETDWHEDEMFYEGCDESSHRKPMMFKGRTPTEGVSTNTPQTANSGRSTVFLKITRPYCDAAAARFADMVLPSDDRNWAIKPTPRPDLIKQLEDSSPYQPAMLSQQQDGVYSPMTGAQPAPPQPQSGLRRMLGNMFGGGQPQEPQPQNALTVAQAAQKAIDKAKESAERAQEQIDDWLVECRYHAEVRKVLESAARVGTGILKGPHPGKTRKRAAAQTAEGWTVEISQKVEPLSKSVSYWNFYPDGSCGDDIQRGSYVFEVDDITARKLMDLKGGDYLDDMIDMCIEEGPTSAVDGTRRHKQGDKTSEKDLFQIWYFHGYVSKKDMISAGCECDGKKETYPCIVTMVNDRIIKVAMSPLDSGEFPYDVMVWQERIGHWAGQGVARQMRECQKGANAAVRNLMDNAGLSAGPQVIVNRDKIRPANGKWEITPRKVWWTVDGEGDTDVSKAFTIINIPTLQQELMAILQFWLKEAEDVTGMPMLLQGQQGKAPETVGGMQILNNNGTTVLRRIARNFDDRVTEPHIGRYYEYLLLHGPDDCKGDFTIDARGSSALVERDAQKQELMQLIGLSLNPAYGMDPELVITEVIKSMRFDPKRMVLSDEKKEEMAKRQPPEDPTVTAAKIAWAARTEITKMTEKVKGINAQADREHESAENEKDRNTEIMVQMVDEKLAGAELSSEERRSLEAIKAKLAATAATLNLQEKLTVMGHRKDLTKHYTPQVAKGGAEPGGRAPDGQAFTK